MYKKLTLPENPPYKFDHQVFSSVSSPKMSKNSGREMDTASAIRWSTWDKNVTISISPSRMSSCKVV